MARRWRVGVVTRSGEKGGHGVELAFAGLPGVEIVAVAEADPAARARVQAETGARTGYADWRAMLERERPDIACLCSREPVGRFDLVAACAAAGCHIYCEKPMAASLADADRMIAAADAAGVRFAVAHPGRHAGALRAARAMVRDGAIGRLLALHGRGKEDERGGGEDLVVLGVHILDLFRFIAGDPQWVFGHVQSDGRPMRRADARRPSEPVGPVAGDDLLALYGFADGVRATFTSRRGLAARGPRLGLTIVGTEATLALRYAGERRLRISRAPAPPEEGGAFADVELPPEADLPGAAPLRPREPGGLWFPAANRAAALDLIAAIGEGRDPLASARDARWALEMALGVHAAHLAGAALPLPLAARGHPLAASTLAQESTHAGDAR